MFKNYFKTVLRNLAKSKGYAFINISSLSIGMACCILLIVYIRYELSFDRYHKNADRIYRLGREMTSVGNEIKEPKSNAVAAKILTSNYPEVVTAVRFRPLGRIVVKFKDKQYYENRIWYADDSIFDVFTFPMISGNPKTALAAPYSVVITEEMTDKYFQGENPIGKILRFNNQFDFHVTGVIKNIPENSHLIFDMLCSLETLYAQNVPGLDDWMSFDFYTYILLKEGINFRELEQKFPAMIETHLASKIRTYGQALKFFLHPLTKIYLYSEREGNPPSRINNIFWNATLAIIILLIACINFMNLATARSTTRSKEVGVRKVVGAQREQLVSQFLTEAWCYSFISLIIAIVMAELALPFIRYLSGANLHIHYDEDPWLLAGFIGLAIIVGAAAGSYPAFFLSSFKPIRVLKGWLVEGRSRARLRTVLVVVQFSLSIMFIYGTEVISRQLTYMKNKNLGFEKKNVVVIPIVDDRIKRSIKSIKKELIGVSGVISAAAASHIPSWNIPMHEKIPEGFSRTEPQLMDEINVDCDFIPTMAIEVMTGRNFSEEFETDNQNAVIINETAAKKFGWNDPIGKTIQYAIGNDSFATRTVIGMVRDFHQRSLYQIIEPLFLGNNPNDLNYLIVRIMPTDVNKTVGFLKAAWSRIDPGRPFDYFFLEDSYDSYHQVVERLRDVFSFFTVFAIFIACLGIFALAAFTVEQKTKEIGIRKVVGATTLSIIFKLNSSLIKPVVIAIILAFLSTQIRFFNLSYFFPYLVELNMFTFFKSAIMLLIIALVTISWQSFKAGRADPVESLRYE
jgi:putative ABC transport system permease protein